MLKERIVTKPTPTVKQELGSFFARFQARLKTHSKLHATTTKLKRINLTHTHTHTHTHARARAHTHTNNKQRNKNRIHKRKEKRYATYLC